jgi:hypothetical protein
VIALFCEGAATEPEYFQALAQLPEVRKTTNLNLRIDLTGAVPLTLVTQAVNAKTQGSADEYWCIFDVEWPRQHPHLAEAIALARKENIPIAMSNPAFELWLLLHHKDHQGHLDTHQAVQERRKFDGSSDKHLDPTKYLPFRSVAAGYAQALRRRHIRDGNHTPHDNPSTNVDELIAAIERKRT